MDAVEDSNLSRSVLFRGSDDGAPKAATAARAMREIYPEMNAQSFEGNVVFHLGLGVFRWADLVIAGLDNREARLAINRYCWKLGKTGIDGAIEKIQGVARVFVPDGPCYECTMSDADWKILQQRRSCNLLARGEMEAGRTPTTPTISSIIAGLQCQEAVKYLHGLPTIAGRGWVFDGLSAEGYQVEYQRKTDCFSHDCLENVIELDASAETATIAQLLGIARENLGGDAELEFAREIVSSLTCPKCGEKQDVNRALGSVAASEAWCPKCTDVRRDVQTFYKIRGDEPFVSLTAAEVGIPAYDIVIARCGGRSVGLELSGDGPQVLGSLFQGKALEWS
jgi:adenylyltransferase/sulfurtransferase